MNMTDKDCATLYHNAIVAAHDALAKCTPIPMVVGTPKTFLGNEIDTTKPMEYIADGVCGFAWVNVKPGNSKFAKWLKANNIARKDDYYGGVTIWISVGNQSMQKKEAYGAAMAKVFADAGINAYMASRMD